MFVDYGQRRCDTLSDVFAKYVIFASRGMAHSLKLLPE